MNNANGTIGATALYLLFSWLISAAGAAWLAERKGYGERLGLTFGLANRRLAPQAPRQALTRSRT